MAAHESSDHAAEHEQHGIGEATLEQLRADLVRLSRLTDSGSSLSAFLEARRVRDRAYRLLDRRLWPREQVDLYFVLGCVNALMGVNANRLGYPDAAEELIRAGWVYANAIDHGPLQGMLRERLSYVMFWRGRFREAHDLAVDGLRYVSQGSAGCRAVRLPGSRSGPDRRPGYCPACGRTRARRPRRGLRQRAAGHRRRVRSLAGHPSCPGRCRACRHPRCGTRCRRRTRTLG